MSITKMNAINSKNDVTTGTKQIKPILGLNPVIAIFSTFFSSWLFLFIKVYLIYLRRRF